MIRILLAADCDWDEATLFKFATQAEADAFLEGVSAVSSEYSTDGCRTHIEGDDLWTSDEADEEKHRSQIAAAFAKDDAPTAEASLEPLDAAYQERNACVAVMARMALALGWEAGLRKTAIEGWDEAWHNCVWIDFPTGQASWHFHDRDADLFHGLPAYDKPWDGHSTPEKYDRLNRFEPVYEEVSTDLSDMQAGIL